MTEFDAYSLACLAHLTAKRYDDKIDAMYEAERQSRPMLYPFDAMGASLHDKAKAQDKRNTERLDAYHERLAFHRRPSIGLKAGT